LHLEKLRWHIIRPIIAITILSVVAFLNRHLLFDVIILGPKDPDFPTNALLCRIGTALSVDVLCFEGSSLKIINVSMSGQFMTHIYISGMAGMVMAIPYIIYEIWSYISFAMNIKNRRAAYSTIFSGTMLFMLGVAFSYFLIVPLTVNFLGTYFVSSEVQNNVTLSSYIGTVTSLVLWTGVVFELPLIMYFLSKYGIVGPEFLVKKRRIMVVLIFIIAAIITPPDVISQIMVSLPMLILYEVSVLIAKRVWKKPVLEE
jgi:sec-independent protein translocase protein TatC